MSEARTFFLAEALRMAEVTQRPLDHWIRMGLVNSSLGEAGGKGTNRAFSRADIVAARVIRSLRKLGFPLAHMKRVAHLAHQFDADDTEIGDTIFVLSDSGAVFQHHDEALAQLMASRGLEAAVVMLPSLVTRTVALVDGELFLEGRPRRPGRPPTKEASGSSPRKKRRSRGTDER